MKGWLFAHRSARSGLKHPLASGLGTIMLGMLGVSDVMASSAPKGDKAFGEYLSTACVTCHQVTGKSTGGIPPIIAWPEDQFVAVMNSYKLKHRENQVMQTIAGGLSDDEIASLATYFGSLPLQPEVK